MFKTGGNGEFLFYPWGIFGRGRVLPDQPTFARLRAKIKSSYILLIVGQPIVLVFVSGSTTTLIWGEFVIFGAYLVWFFLGPIRQVRKFAYSDEKLKLRESYANSARSHNLWILIALFFCSLLFVAGGIFMITDKAVGLGSLDTAFFGFCTVAIGSMILRKLKDR
ncbi:MAG TPA: hypothetical protein VGM16_05240 [Gammaproteobacteria bacterium]